MASMAAWREFLMKALDAVYLHGRVDGERDPVETLLASHATKALSMVRFTRCTQDPIGDGSSTAGTFLQRVLDRDRRISF
jgi:hypothetical protein